MRSRYEESTRWFFLRHGHMSRKPLGSRLSISVRAPGVARSELRMFHWSFAGRFLAALCLVMMSAVTTGCVPTDASDSKTALEYAKAAAAAVLAVAGLRDGSIAYNVSKGTCTSENLTLQSGRVWIVEATEPVQPGTEAATLAAIIKAFRATDTWQVIGDEDGETFPASDTDIWLWPANKGGDEEVHIKIDPKGHRVQVTSRGPCFQTAD